MLSKAVSQGSKTECPQGQQAGGEDSTEMQRLVKTQPPVCTCSSNCHTPGEGPRVARATKFSSKVRSPDFT